MPERSNSPAGAGGWRRIEGAVTAREVVVAMGPWSDQVFAPLGYSIPLNVKRGYHLHLKARGNAVLHHPVLDSDHGYLLAPMNRGIRLTTGVEFAHRDAPPQSGAGRAGAAAGAKRCFRWEIRSTPNPGRARGPVCRTCCR